MRILVDGIPAVECHTCFIAAPELSIVLFSLRGKDGIATERWSYRRSSLHLPWLQIAPMEFLDWPRILCFANSLRMIVCVLIYWIRNKFILTDKVAIRYWLIYEWLLKMRLVFDLVRHYKSRIYVVVWAVLLLTEVPYLDNDARHLIR